MTAGYSKTPLCSKLGIKPGVKVLLINQPPDYKDLLDSDISNQLVKTTLDADIVHVFVKSRKEFEQELSLLAFAYKRNPELVIWVSWYKKASGIKTDMTEDVIRNYALAHGLVDIKVCAVSDIWSGLKLVVPKAKR